MYQVKEIIKVFFCLGSMCHYYQQKGNIFCLP